MVKRTPALAEEHHRERALHLVEKAGIGETDIELTEIPVFILSNLSGTNEVFLGN